MSNRTKKSDYEGIIEVSQKLYKLLRPNQIPKRPEEIIALADAMKKKEETYQKARRAKQDIINLRKTWKERAEYAREADRLYRRYQLEKIWRKMRSVAKPLYKRNVPR
ncbi:MAG: hypothetical protein LV468_04585 [Candidatus Nitrosotenuis sp.]|nr:hypothetical protein [Candidatus Nitrosotenuis sp.]